MPIPTAFPSVCVRQVADDDPLDGRARSRRPGVVASDDVRVHPEPADVLADRVEDEDVDRVEREAGHRVGRHREQLGLACRDQVGRDGLDVAEPRVAVLDERKAERDRGTGERVRGGGRDQLVEDRETLPMEGIGPLLLAQPDGDHLHQPALDRPREVRVDLHPVDRDDQVRSLERVAIDEHRDAGRTSPRSTVSMEERISQPIESAVIP